MKLARTAIALLAILNSSQVLAQDAPVSLGDRLIQDAKDDSVASVQQDLAKGADVNSRHKNGRTALMWAAELDKADFVRLLVAHGAVVNAKANDGTTALSLAEGDEQGVDEDLVDWLRAHRAQ